MPTVLTKSLAIDALIEALGLNRSPQAEQTLEQIVSGRIEFGGHAKQAAQAAMLQLAFRPTPESEAFLLRIFSEPDETIRPGDHGAYPAADLRADTARVLTSVGSAKLRLELAKIYSQSGTPAAVRLAIEEIVKSPVTANFSAQVAVFRSSEASAALKETLQQTLLQKNESAMKVALRLEGESSPLGSGKTGLGTGAPFSPFGGAPAGANPAALFANAAKMFGLGGAAGGKGPPAGFPPAAMPGFPPGPGAPAADAKAGAADGKAAPGLAQGLRGFRRRAQAAEGGAAAPNGAAPAANAAPATPAMMILSMMGQMLSLQPIDPGLVARELWTADFVDSISSKLAGGKGEKLPLVNALASIPIKAAREKLREFLKKETGKGPNDLGKADTTAEATADDATASPAPSGRRLGGGRRRNKGKGDDEEPAAAKVQTPKAGGFGMGIGMGIGARNASEPAKPAVADIGKDWLDPGTLVVVKSVVSYEERPPEKKVHRPAANSYSLYGRRQMSAAAERRAHEKAAKQKALEAGYEWRDAIHKLIQEWDERLGAVAEAPADAAGGSESGSSADDKPSSSTAKDSKRGAGPKTVVKTGSSSKGNAKSSETADAEETKASANPAPSTAVPTPSVAMAFGLHAGGAIAKEYHLRWPQDLAASAGSSVNDPLIVDYVRLEGKADLAKTLTHYRQAIGPVGPGKTVKTRSIEDGKWLDVLQKDATTHRTRSVDIFLTRQSSDDDEKKSKLADVTVEILLVEIETPGPEVSSHGGKKEHRETTSFTPNKD